MARADRVGDLAGQLGRGAGAGGFPAGPVLLTDWGPSRTNLFRITAEEHKLTLIRSLLAGHPGLRVVLVGDTGQLDPEIYATVATGLPDRVRAVYVRRTTGMTPARAIEIGGVIRGVGAAGVPMLMVEDSVQVAEHAAGLGLLDATDVRAVRRASRAEPDPAAVPVIIGGHRGCSAARVIAGARPADRPDG